MINIRLEKLRERKGISKAELCRQLKIPQTTYSGYALGTREPDIEMIKRFAEYYNVSIDFLISGSDNSEFQTRIDKIVEDLHSLSDEDQEYIYTTIQKIKKSSN